MNNVSDVNLSLLFQIFPLVHRWSPVGHRGAPLPGVLPADVHLSPAGCVEHSAPGHNGSILGGTGEQGQQPR